MSKTRRTSDPTVALEAPGTSTSIVAVSGVSMIEEPVSSLLTPAQGDALLAGRYELVALVGAGGMGSVYRVHDHELNEVVALKVLRRELADLPGVVERFRDEVKLARRVTHPNVARVFDIGEHEGEKFLTMELIEGEPLSALIGREGALGVERAAEIASAIAAGLGSAHAAGVVHRDLKPDNVLLGRDGRIVITDFGIACALMDAGAIKIDMPFGSPAYMAPEQVSGAIDIDARADVYSFGTVLFEMLTGRRAWTGDSPFMVASARLTSPPPDPRALVPDLPEPLAALVVRCLARRPIDRPSPIEEVAAAIATMTLPTPRALPVVMPARSLEESAPRAADLKTIAVIPFRNAGSPDDDYLAEELTDDLIDALSMTSGLRVRARGVVARAHDADRDPREIGRALDVQVVAAGSVRKASSKVRIQARLISVADGFQLWAKRIERPEQDVIAMNDEVARAIVEALTLDGPLPREAPSDPEAVDLYLRARHEYRRFWPEHLRRAIALFERAEQISPNDPMILAGNAMSRARLSFFEGEARIAEARRVAERAVAAGPNMGEAHLALGSVLLQCGEPARAVRSMRAAIARSPGLAEAHAALGRLLVEVGEIDEGARRLGAALDLDPAVPLAASALLRMHALLGDAEKAEAYAAGMRESEGAFSYAATRLRLALARVLPAPKDVSLDGAPPGAAIELPNALLTALRTGQLPEGFSPLGMIEKTLDLGLRRRLMYLQMTAELTSYLHDHEATLRALERAGAIGLADKLWIDRCKSFDELRSDARFIAIADEVTLRARSVIDAHRAS